MGVKGLTTWVGQHYQDCVVDATHASFDHVFVDMPCVLHETMRAASSSDMFAKLVFQRLDEALTVTPPRKSLFLALDGPAPLAKLLTQRVRRHKEYSVVESSGVDLEDSTDSESADDEDYLESVAGVEEEATGGVASKSGGQEAGPGLSEPDAAELARRAPPPSFPDSWWTDPKEKRMRSVALTPGTPFMLWVDHLLEYWVYQRLSNARWSNILIELSPSRHAGEGELKLFHRMHFPITCSTISTGGPLEQEGVSPASKTLLRKPQHPSAPYTPKSARLFGGRYRSQETVLVLGADTDMLMMALISRVPNIFIRSTSRMPALNIQPRNKKSIITLREHDPRTFAMRVDPKAVLRRGPRLTAVSVDRLRALLLDSPVWAHIQPLTQRALPVARLDQRDPTTSTTTATTTAATSVSPKAGTLRGPSARPVRVTSSLREPLGVTMDAKRLGSAAVSALEAAAMDLAVMQVMACGNDYLDKVGGARLDPGNVMGYDCRGVLEAYALVLGSPGMQGRSIVLSVAGRIWLDLEVLRRVLLVSLHPTVIAKTTVGWEYNRGIFPFIFPEPETVVYLFGLQWTIDMYRFNRVLDVGYSHPNHAGFIGNFISDLTLMVAAQRDERGVANDEAADEGIEALRAGGGAGAGTEEAEGLYFRLRDVDQAGLARGRELLQRWRDMSRGVGDPKDEHTKPLKPHACAMALLPLAALPVAPPPLMPLMTPGSPLWDIYAQCDVCDDLRSRDRTGNQLSARVKTLFGAIETALASYPRGQAGGAWWCEAGVTAAVKDLCVLTERMPPDEPAGARADLWPELAQGQRSVSKVAEMGRILSQYLDLFEPPTRPHGAPQAGEEDNDPAATVPESAQRSSPRLCESEQQHPSTSGDAPGATRDAAVRLVVALAAVAGQAGLAMSASPPAGVGRSYLAPFARKLSGEVSGPGEGEWDARGAWAAVVAEAVEASKDAWDLWRVVAAVIWSGRVALRTYLGKVHYLSIDHKIGAHPYQPFPTERLRQVVDAVPPEAYPPELRPLCYLEPSHVYKRGPVVLPSGAQVAGLAGTSGRTEALPGPPTPSWAALPSAATKVSKVCISYAEFTRSVFPKGTDEPFYGRVRRGAQSVREAVKGTGQMRRGRGSSRSPSGRGEAGDGEESGAEAGERPGKQAGGAPGDASGGGGKRRAGATGEQAWAVGRGPARSAASRRGGDVAGAALGGRTRLGSASLSQASRRVSGVASLGARPRRGVQAARPLRSGGGSMPLMLK